MEEQKKQILNENLRLLLLKFSAPTITGMITIALYNFVDTLFVGKAVGPDAIAGLTIVIPVSSFLFAIGLLTGVGASSIVSRSLGSGDAERAITAGADSIILNVIFNVIVIIPVWIYSREILEFLGASGEVLPYALDYLNTLLPGYLFLSFSVNGTNLIRAEGKPRASMHEMLIGAILNIILDYLFVIVFGWGVKGAAIATVISHIASATYIFIFFMSKNSIFHLKFNVFGINKSISGEILKLGTPSFLMEIVVSVVFLLFVKSVSKYGGDVYLSVTGIGMRVIDLIFMPLIGISQGFSPIVGFNYGAKLYARVKKVLKEALIWTVFIASLGFIIVMAFPDVLISIFTSDAEVIEKGIGPLRVIAMFLPLSGFPIIGSAFFQAIGKARPSMFITLSRDLFFFIPAIILLPQVFGLSGIWITWPLTDLCCFIMTTIFLLMEIKIINRKMDMERIS